MDDKQLAFLAAKSGLTGICFVGGSPQRLLDCKPAEHPVKVLSDVSKRKRLMLDALIREYKTTTGASRK
jgi:proteasome assembly chaperone (PAC2) family protein